MFKRQMNGGFIFILVIVFMVTTFNGNTYAATQDNQLNQHHASNGNVNKVKTRVILPNEKRTQIDSTTSGHYQSIGYINIGDNIATGVVIDKNTVLTNKHVAHLADGNMTFAPAAQNQNTMPFGTFTEKDIKVYPGNEDIAIVHFNENKQGQTVGDVVQPATLKADSTLTENTPITVTGYPGDKSLATMWESKGDILKVNGSEFTYNASTFGGNSGSPVFNKSNEVIGIHQGGIEGESNSAVTIKGDVLNFIKNNKA
ncbi:trypsin-like serine peptidase [Staphylococcus edaphicus]|uniref:Serine protease n=1 Tax=Staphylococcus edaphicus TaxID=1955013 RepID=A0A2C6WL59_9STAP|nr:serine protease [Staphylococcus edaphicus]PHK48534.1 serine protease [Staphylococcus edaphicus]UQW81843.1 serine protease [Staphylococcus edaphicus]